jgi:two-component system sensor histidine kinase CpxA
VALAIFLMRNLYWKIFISFWLATILIIVSTAWVTSEFVQIPWAGRSARIVIAIFISGLICYLLSIYLTRPLRSLRLAAKSIATGHLSTRVGHFAGHNNDEIAELSHEFDSMAEQLEQLIESKQRLLQDISHELRSPLARLQIAIELGRKKTNQNHSATNEFDRMESECLRLNSLIGEALDFARLDHSTNTLSPSLIDLPTLIEGIINDANYEFAKTSPRVIVDKMDACLLMLDARLIHRAIENILRNALHYSPIDQVVIISLHIDKLKKQVIIDIKDSGPGVPDKQLTKIFSPFYRVDPAREKKTGGYGLGLAIAKKAIQLHHGDIKATNRKQGGLLMSIKLPLRQEA